MADRPDRSNDTEAPHIILEGVQPLPEGLLEQRIEELALGPRAAAAFHLGRLREQWVEELEALGRDAMLEPNEIPRSMLPRTPYAVWASPRLPLPYSPARRRP